MLRPRRHRTTVIFGLIVTGLLYHLAKLNPNTATLSSSSRGFGNFRDKWYSQGKAVKDGVNIPGDFASASPKLDQHNAKLGSNYALKYYEEAIADEVTNLNRPTVPPANRGHSALHDMEVPSGSSEPTTRTLKSLPISITRENKVSIAQSLNAITGLIWPTVSLTAASNFASSGPSDIDYGSRSMQPSLDVPLHQLHWSKISENFPVAASSLIQLPSGLPRKLPRIQHDFSSLIGAKRLDQDKLNKIKSAFLFSWKGYKEYAWLHDELTPKSGKWKDPFNGWGATIVDALDSLWILGLESEFEEAVAAVKGIDFSTSMKNDIALFETVIRYLGGLLGAYDVSGNTYQALLDKAIELADILLGAFDTPNRMPITYYSWKPALVSQPRRAGSRVVLAEIGSLSLEFTRLAQITNDTRYYDAIARIANNLQEFQNNTLLPGLWPLSLDASGCKKLWPSTRRGTATLSTDSLPPSLHYNLAHIYTPTAHTRVQGYRQTSISMMRPYSTDAQSKQDMDSLQSAYQASGYSTTTDDVEVSLQTTSQVCEVQGFTSPPYATVEEFGIGAQADSTYEYLPKAFALLGGLVPEYKTMYEMAAGAIKQNLLFRAMIPDEGRSVYQVGLYRKHAANVSNEPSDPRKSRFFVPEGTHLTCFAGGMFAVAARIFDRGSEDLDIAKKLTDGCIWAYEVTATGIMPEVFQVIPCDSLDNCKWNETKWTESLDPARKLRENKRLAQAKAQEFDGGSAAEKLMSPIADIVISANPALRQNMTLFQDSLPAVNPDHKSSAEMSGPEFIVPDPQPKAQVMTDQSEHPSALDPLTDEADLTISNDGKHEMRYVDLARAVLPDENLRHQDSIITSHVLRGPISNLESVPNISTKSLPRVPSPSTTIADYPILSHEEFVQNRVKTERIPKGMTRLSSKKYFLRPEAIESVFIMYRVTGDDYWREKGWMMFESIERATKSNFGASSIRDVTDVTSFMEDKMESFWLAETLKYFYLLFSDPESWSLDDYVL